MDTHQTVAAFLGAYGFDSGGISVNGLIDSLLYDMNRGLAEEAKKIPTALAPAEDMIPTWALPPASVPKNTTVIVIDAGGTNFRVCLVSFDAEGKPAISDLEKFPMPATDRELSKKDFFDAIASKLNHVKNKATKIGFCFSYAMHITPDQDGEVIAFSKEIKAPEVIGSKVGESLANALAAQGWTRPERIVLLNDTTAALLAGAATVTGGKSYDSFVGLILGTGLNSAYIESETIPKIQGQPSIPKSQIVVCESGNFNKLPRSYFDIETDKATATPGFQVYEKMCSGGYIGSVVTCALKQAARDGLFSQKVAALFTANDTKITLKDMDQFLYFPKRTDTALGAILAQGQGTTEDAELVYALLDKFVDRSARLAAALIAAAVIKSGKGKNPASPVCVVCEGTTFEKTHNLKPRVLAYIDETLAKQRHIYAEIVMLENAITMGAAIAGAAS